MVYQYGSLTEKSVLNSELQKLCDHCFSLSLSSIILYHSEVSISPGWLLGQEPPDTVKIIKSLPPNRKGNLQLRRNGLYPMRKSRMIIVTAVCYQINYLSSRELSK